MATAYRVVLFVHMIAGICGLLAFWVPAFARKGRTAHVQVGRVFYRATGVVAATGLAMAALLVVDPLGIKPPSRPVSPERAAAIAAQVRLMSGFLVYLVLITFVPVYHGIRVLATRYAPQLLRTSLHTAMNITVILAAVAMIGIGLFARQPVLLALSPIGVLIGFGNLGFARRPYATPMAWWYEHMGSMIGGGVAFHTAFLVLGAGRLFGISLTGPVAVVPWLLPTIIGIPATAIWVSYYKRRFGDAGATATPVEKAASA